MGRAPLLVALAMLAATLTAAAEAPARVIVRDSLGHDVALGSSPRRIVSLVPSATEILFAIGADDRLVGVTDFCDFPPAARKKRSVGGMIDPSLEAIVALHPDLVIATRDGNREETVTQLERLRIPTFLVEAHRVADVATIIGALAELTDHRAGGASVTSGLEKRLAAVRNTVAPWPRPRVLYVVWPDPVMVPGRDALVTELIRVAGGDSVSATEPQSYPQFSIEAAVARHPDLVVFANHGAGSTAMPTERWERLTRLPTLHGARIVSVDGNLLHRYGPRIADGVEMLARSLHPEAFRR